jgi:hypothetical protein
MVVVGVGGVAALAGYDAQQSHHTTSLTQSSTQSSTQSQNAQSTVTATPSAPQATSGGS